MQNIIDRFISYVVIDTESDPNSNTTPSTKKQWNLANKLVEELKSIGLEEVTIDKNAYIMATLPSNVSHDVPTIGFISHFDTTPDFTGANVNPQIIKNYDGNDIVLNKENNIILKNAFEVSSEFVDDHIKISENKKDEDMLNKYDMYINEQINNIKSTAEYYINSNYLDNNPDLKDKLNEIYNTFLSSNNTELTKVASKLRNLLHEISLIKDKDSNK